METMYLCFGQSWAALHLGPMWSYVEEIHAEKVTHEAEVDVLATALEESGLRLQRGNYMSLMILKMNWLAMDSLIKETN